MEEAPADTSDLFLMQVDAQAVITESRRLPADLPPMMPPRMPPMVPSRKPPSASLLEVDLHGDKIPTGQMQGSMFFLTCLL